MSTNVGVRFTGDSGGAVTATQRVEQAIGRLRSKEVTVGVDTRRAISGVQTLDQHIERTTSRISQFTRAIGGYVAAFGAERVVEGTIRAATRYDTAIRQFAASTGIYGKALGQWQDTIRNVAARSPDDINEVGTAIGVLAANFGASIPFVKEHTNQILAFVRYAGGQLPQTLQSMRQVLSAYGQNISGLTPLMDKLSVAQQRFLLDAGQAAPALAQGAPYLRAYGLSLDESIALMGQFSSRGLDVMQVMRGLGLSVQKTTKEFGGPGGVQNAVAGAAEKVRVAQERLDQLRITTVHSNAALIGHHRAWDTATAALAKARTHYDLVREAVSKSGGAHATVTRILHAQLDQLEHTHNAQERLNLAVSIFGASAGPKIAQGLAGGNRQLREYIKRLEESEGASERVARETEGGLAAKLAIARHQLEATGTSIGEVLVPALTKGASFLSAMANAVERVSGAVPGLRLALGTLAGAAGLHVLAESQVFGAPIRGTFGRIPGGVGRFFGGQGQGFGLGRTTLAGIRGLGPAGTEANPVGVTIVGLGGAAAAEAGGAEAGLQGALGRRRGTRGLRGALGIGRRADEGAGAPSAAAAAESGLAGGLYRGRQQRLSRGVLQQAEQMERAGGGGFTGAALPGILPAARAVESRALVSAEQAALVGTNMGRVADAGGFRSVRAIASEQAALSVAARGAAYSPAAEAVAGRVGLGGRLLGGLRGMSGGTAGLVGLIAAPLIGGATSAVLSHVGVGGTRASQFGSVATGAISGAGIGSMIFPGIGTAIGAVGGALISAATSGLLGSIGLGGGDPGAARRPGIQAGFAAARGLGGEAQRTVGQALGRAAEAGAALPGQQAGLPPALRQLFAGPGAAGRARTAEREAGGGFAQAFVGAHQQGFFTDRTIDDAVKRMGKLPAAARAAAAQSMIEWARATEQQGRLPKGATERLMSELEHRYGDMRRTLRALGISSMGDLEKTIKAAKIGQALTGHRREMASGVQDMVDEAHKKWPDLVADVKVTGGNMAKEWNRLQAELKRATTTGSKASRDAARPYYDLMVKDHDKAMHRMRSNANRSAGLVAKAMSRMAGSGAGAVNSLLQATGLGFGWLTTASNQMLRNLGAQAVKFGVTLPPNIQAAVNVAGGGGEAWVPDPDVGVGSIGAGARGMRTPGRPGPDHLAIVDERSGRLVGKMAPGELIVAGSTEARLDQVLGLYGTSLSAEVAAESVPHFATGGSAATRILQAKGWAESQMGKPYVWGAGHSYGTFPAYDCSGFATNAAVRAGSTAGIGTTYTAIAASRPARGTEPFMWGFSRFGAKGHEGPGHMGVRILGEVMQFGNPGHTGGSFPLWKVPAGLPDALDLNVPTPRITGPASAIRSIGQGDLRTADHAVNRYLSAALSGTAAPIGPAEGDLREQARSGRRLGGRIFHAQTGFAGGAAAVTGTGGGGGTSVVASPGVDPVQGVTPGRGRTRRGRKPPGTTTKLNPLTGMTETRTAASWRVVNTTVTRLGEGSYARGAALAQDVLAGIGTFARPGPARALERLIGTDITAGTEAGAPEAAAITYEGALLGIDTSTVAGVAGARAVLGALTPLQRRLSARLRTVSAQHPRTRALRRARTATMDRINKSLAQVDNALTQALGTITGARVDPLQRIADTEAAQVAGLQRQEPLTEGRVSRRAYSAATARGATPEEAQAAADRAVLDAQIHEKEEERKRAGAAIDKLLTERRKVSGQIENLDRGSANYHTMRAQLIARRNQIDARIRGYKADIAEAGEAISGFEFQERQTAAAAAAEAPTAADLQVAEAGTMTDAAGNLTTEGRALMIQGLTTLRDNAQKAYDAAIASNDPGAIIKAAGELSSANSNLAGAMSETASSAQDAADALRDQRDRMTQIGLTTAQLDAAWLQTVSRIGQIGSLAPTNFAGVRGDAYAAGSLLGVAAEGASALAGLPSYQEGTDYVPRTGLAMLHAGERVTPAGAGEGGDLHVHIHSHTFHPASPAHHNEIASTVIRAINSQGVRRRKRRFLGA